MISSLRRSSRAVRLCDRFKFSSQRRLCVLLTTIFRPSVPGGPSSLKASSLRVLTSPSTGARIVARRFAPLSTLATPACQHASGLAGPRFSARQLFLFLARPAAHEVPLPAAVGYDA